MRNKTIIFSLFALLVSMIACGGGTGDFEQAARELVDTLAEENFTETVKTFDATMSAAFPAEKLEETWTQLQEQAGTFEEQLSVRTEKQDQYVIVFVTCKFSKANLDVKVVYNSRKQVAGLWIVPPKS
jgi:hypothetical protein